MSEFKMEIELADRDREHDWTSHTSRILGTCVCGYDIEADDPHIIVDSDYLCDWDCVQDWVKNCFYVKEVK